MLPDACTRALFALWEAAPDLRGARWLELLCKHIPDRYEHLVRYVGWYSNRARGERAKALGASEAQAPPLQPAASAEPAERGPPAPAPEWPRNAVIPIPYHLVSDIA